MTERERNTTLEKSEKMAREDSVRFETRSRPGTNHPQARPSWPHINQSKNLKM